MMSDKFFILVTNWDYDDNKENKINIAIEWNFHYYLIYQHPNCFINLLGHNELATNSNRDIHVMTY